MSTLRVVSVSLGSPERDRKVQAELLGHNIEMERVGTGGDLDEAERLLEELSGEVDALGLGGIDLYLWIGERKYTVRDAVRLKEAAGDTPVVDGSGLKHTMEREAVEWLRGFSEHLPVPLQASHALMVSGVDRWGMAEALSENCAGVTYGDLVFALGLPFPLYSLESLRRVAGVLVPIAVRLPFQALYPTGDEQNRTTSKYANLYREADLVAGDFHFIKKHLPEELPETSILTNTTTEADRERLREAGVHSLITTTPVFDGRSFGTNLLEAAFAAIGGPEKAGDREFYRELLSELDYTPGVQHLQDEPATERAG